MPLTIRPAIQADHPTIRSLIAEARINRMSLNWPNFVVAEEDGAIVGVGQVKAHDDGSRELASIAVVPARQRQGIGRAIIETLLAREPGVVLYLTCRRELEDYYKRFGFRLLVESEYPPYFRRVVPLVNAAMRLLRFGTQIVVMRREAAV
ncbi:MAG TPA: GNAT family N-acetyltransferase [Candidatus Dormibacteraeota bacterium]|nr:GNAT family N-acetyltransferase [Candidatus Dormibacteraeota bacterium]